MPSREAWRCRAVFRVVLRLETRGTLGRHPEGFSRLGVLGDTWRARNAPGTALSVEHSGHVAYSQCSRRVLSAWAFGTRVVLGRLPDGVSRLRHTRHVAHSEGFRRVALGVGFGDTWHSPKGFRRVSRCGFRGHVARSERFRRRFR